MFSHGSSMSTNSPIYYKPSKKTPPLSFVVSGLGILIAGPIIGIIYALAIFYCPFIYINFFLTIGTGYAIGFVISKAVSIGKMRNPMWAGILALTGSFLVLYVHWVVWILAALEYQYLVLFPQDVWAVIVEFGANGVWEMFGSTPSGLLLYAIWLVEALIIFITALQLPIEQTNKLFCEVCSRWVKNEEQSSRKLAFGEDENLITSTIEAAMSGDVLQLNQLEEAPDGTHHYLKLETSSCKTCERINFMSLSNTTITFDDDGNAKVDSEPIIQHMLLNFEDYESLRTGQPV